MPSDEEQPRTKSATVDGAGLSEKATTAGGGLGCGERVWSLLVDPSLLVGLSGTDELEMLRGFLRMVSGGDALAAEPSCIWMVQLPHPLELGRPRGWYGSTESLYLPAPDVMISP